MNGTARDRLHGGGYAAPVMSFASGPLGVGEQMGVGREEREDISSVEGVLEVGRGCQIPRDLQLTSILRLSQPLY